MNPVLDMERSVSAQLILFISHAIRRPDLRQELIALVKKIKYNTKTMEMKYKGKTYPLHTVLSINIVVIHNLLEKSSASSNNEKRKTSSPIDSSPEEGQKEAIQFKNLPQQQQQDLITHTLVRLLKERGCKPEMAKEVLRGFKVNSILFNKNLRSSLVVQDGLLNIDLDITDGRCCISVQ